MNETAITERNRANAQHSTGPRSQAGKAIVSRNALRHGVLGMAPVVAGLERPQDWQRHLQQTCESLQPVGHLELVYAERIALLLWKQARVARYEQYAINHEQHDVEDAIGQRNRQEQQAVRIKLDLPPSVESTHPEDIRADAERAAALLAALEHLGSSDAAAPVAWEAADALIWRLYDEAAPEEDADVPIPGTPPQEPDEELAEWCARVAWTAALLRAAVAAFAEHAGESAAELVRRIRRDADSKANSTAYKLQETEAAIRRAQEARLLPDELSLTRISRYDAGIERSLSRALAELERLQSRRQGRALPATAED